MDQKKVYREACNFLLGLDDYLYRQLFSDKFILSWQVFYLLKKRIDCCRGKKYVFSAGFIAVAYKTSTEKARVALNSWLFGHDPTVWP